jgi:hypothetical protein
MRAKERRTASLLLIARLLLGNILRLGLLLAQEADEEVVRVPTDNQARSNRRLSISDQSLTTDLLHLPFVGSKHILLRLSALLQWEEDNALSIAVNLTSGLPDVGELGIEGGQRRVAERVGLCDVRRDVFVGLGEVGRE